VTEIEIDFEPLRRNSFDLIEDLFVVVEQANSSYWHLAVVVVDVVEIHPKQSSSNSNPCHVLSPSLSPS